MVSVVGLRTGPGVCSFCLFVCKFLSALIAFLIGLQLKCENLLSEKQPKFTKTSTPQVNTQYRDRVRVQSHLRFIKHELLHELFSPCNHKKMSTEPIIGLLIPTKVDQIAVANAHT